MSINHFITLGGKKRTNGMFAYIEKGKFEIGHRHMPMAKTDRCRFFNTNSNGDFCMKYFGRRYCNLFISSPTF